MKTNEAFLGSAAFLVVAPGTIAVLIPWLISHWRAGDDATMGLTILGGVLIVAGAIGLIDSFVRFARKGGTPAPIAPTKHLVVDGLYRYVRNPMYLSVLAVIFGQALAFANAGLIAYFVSVALAVHLFVVGYEEPTLKDSFPEEYEAYIENVGRWLPRLTPWRDLQS